MTLCYRTDRRHHSSVIQSSYSVAHTYIANLQTRNLYSFSILLIVNIYAFVRSFVRLFSSLQRTHTHTQVVLVQGHYLSYLPLCSRNEPVFLATCTPIAMPETRECIVQGATNVFTTIHSMDMKIIHMDKK